MFNHCIDTATCAPCPCNKSTLSICEAVPSCIKFLKISTNVTGWYIIKSKNYYKELLLTPTDGIVSIPVRLSHYSSERYEITGWSADRTVGLCFEYCCKKAQLLSFTTEKKSKMDSYLLNPPCVQVEKTCISRILWSENNCITRVKWCVNDCNTRLLWSAM